MTDLLEFASGLLDGLGLLAFSLLLGGLAYAIVVLQSLRISTSLDTSLSQRCYKVIFYSGVTLIVLRLLQLCFKYMALAQVMGDDLWAAFVQTELFRAGLLSVGMIGALVYSIRWVGRQPTHVFRWGVVFLFVCGLLANEARLTHAASRLEGREWLMIVTMVHVLGATIWAGGVSHLLLSRWTLRGSPQLTSLWPILVARFSYIGIPSMVFIVGPGVYLAWRYVGSFSGLVGTGYGNMVLVKVCFLLLVFLLAILNFGAGRRWRQTQDASPFTQRVSAYVEIEIILAIGLLFTAASLTGFPPAIDVSNDAATPHELWIMYDPKMPRVTGPEMVWIDAPELTNLSTGEMGKKKDSSWDRFNHNISGAIVIIMAVMAMLDVLGRVRWARPWPLMFVGFSILIFVFSNPDHWPLGFISLADSLQSTEVIQHWLAAFVVFGLGWFEWNARQKTFQHSIKKFIFPSLCIVGGIILLTHSHSISALKTDFLAQSTHVSMGFLGVIMGCARWLELRLFNPHARWAGLVSIGSMMLVGFILLFYVNPEMLDL